MITIEVNNRTIEAEQGEILLDVLKRAGISIPTLCHMENFFPSGACRMCVVEMEGRPALIPSCAYPVHPGMKIKTYSPRVLQARKTIIELLLANHPDDCLYCTRNGNCKLQSLAGELGVREKRFEGERSHHEIDLSSPSLVRDPDKCILCGRCVRVCEEVIGVSAIDYIGRGSKTIVGTAFNEGLNKSTCINCGQCITVCPTGALRERSYVKQVMDAINNPDLTVVVQHAPAVSVTIGEDFGVEGGADVAGKMVAALRQIGFNKVFDTSFSADLTIMEEASELVKRITTGGVLPMFTSCSPGWIKYMEQFYPEMLPNLSTCKSPQQMLGAVIKSYFAEKEGLDPSKIFSVSIMPCTAKKFECARPEMLGDSITPDVDAVLTTRELARLIHKFGIDLKNLEPSEADLPFGERTTAGKLFGATGGVMEAAVRTAYHLITGNELADLKIEAVRGLDGVKEAHLDINGLKVGVAVVSGIGNVKQVIADVKDGKRPDLHFIEVMTCPGGCVGGGGQPLGTDLVKIKSRMQGLYKLDSEGSVRTSHSNESIKKLYAEFLGEPLGEKSHHLLHTHYKAR